MYKLCSFHFLLASASACQPEHQCSCSGSAGCSNQSSIHPCNLLQVLSLVNLRSIKPRSNYIKHRSNFDHPSIDLRSHVDLAPTTCHSNKKREKLRPGLVRLPDALPDRSRKYYQKLNLAFNVLDCCSLHETSHRKKRLY